GASLVSALDLDTLLTRLLEAAQELTGARYAALGVLDAERREIERFLTRGVDAATHRAVGDPPRGRGILGLLTKDPRPLRLAEIEDDPRAYGFPSGHPQMHRFHRPPPSPRAIRRCPASSGGRSSAAASLGATST